MVHVPRALAARDTRGLIKLVASVANDQLLGAHILAPKLISGEASPSGGQIFEMVVRQLRNSLAW